MDAVAAFCILLVLATTISFSAGCFTHERDALLSFKGNIVRDPQNILATWNGQDCCQWSGVKCSNSTGHVIKIDLRNNFFLDDILVPSDSDNPRSMRGKISSSLTVLHHLEYLDLSGNNLGGVGVSIPRFWALSKAWYI
ncbi:unnamed protein product [Miscanthus lutarioriparius]|uniref:Leucine-rich repeat-containing N-terminal plant-type domain-containing protein n=1 Tax=Miscanthus lutarioriparius TaxID=422564 RepID=A0A811RDP2_9POAL|nr:unnamed protein product [Miscanthus lutarioriparius]